MASTYQSSGKCGEEDLERIELHYHVLLSTDSDTVNWEFLKPNSDSRLTIR